MKIILKRALPQDLRSSVKTYLNRINFKIAKCCSKSAFLSSAYYFLFNKSFRRENQSVLNGRLQYESAIQDSNKSNVLLRRNIHRIEKGLIMRPRRSVFGLGFIEETVHAYVKEVEVNKVSHQELKWATDVLSEYFETIDIGTSKLVDELRRKYEKAIKDTVISFEHDIYQPNKGSYSPYFREDNETSGVSYNQLLMLFKQRRSVRWFQQTPVPEEIINKAIRAASLAPSACNRQPFKFYTTTDKKVAKEVGAIPMGTAGFSSNFQSVIVVTGDLSCYPYERDRHVIYIDASLASMQLVLALETMEVSSCIVNWPDIEHLEQKMEDRLGLSKHIRPIMLIAVGYADKSGKIPFSQKKGIDLLKQDI
ncbi:nitroreductase family protein [Vibrio algivorus]|uniref:Nitroreductase domain-containing protein n=1 Tax=Vibrio algivorus TaxID=1667024 RepID=A0ABQ6EKM6_9VIBR|nr:nitroreductase family protein [Vibrio algivorus]GLT13170.1 hypothetical protein GCM10007931_01440 [Vibrio algivorus]